tara:strand:- start:799 stop:1368 length:570 start_codon:yes stop_codon:yes gene_type:complete
MPILKMIINILLYLINILDPDYLYIKKKNNELLAENDKLINDYIYISQKCDRLNEAFEEHLKINTDNNNKSTSVINDINDDKSVSLITDTDEEKYEWKINNIGLDIIGPLVIDILKDQTKPMDCNDILDKIINLHPEWKYNYYVSHGKKEGMAIKYVLWNKLKTLSNKGTLIKYGTATQFKYKLKNNLK